MVRVRYSFGSRHTGRIANIKKQRGKYPDVMKDVVRVSDIILEILDARYIEETRNLELEGQILDKGKLLIYVINKIDLVDKEALEKSLPKWMKPYIFISATSGIGLNEMKGRIKMEAKRIVKEREEVEKERAEKRKVYEEKLSAEEGEKKNSKYKKEEKDSTMNKDGSKKKQVVYDLASKKRIHVGIVGYPNAGKSTVINFITRKGAAKTAKQAGFTKGMQKIRLSEGILLLDTPGVIPLEKYSTEHNMYAGDVKVGGRTYSDVKDPETSVFYLIKADEPEDPENITEEEQGNIDNAEKNCKAIEKFYGIEFDGDVEVLIEKLGQRLKHFGKGRKVDEDRTARIILRDWQTGKIRF